MRRVTDLADRLLEAAKNRARAAAAGLVEAVPVNTGRTAASFQATIGAPAVGTDQGPGHYDAGTVLAEINAVIDAAGPGDTVFVTSDYIGAKKAEAGSRNLPPRHMVEAASMRFRNG